jgi:hypothetical protein
MIMFILDKVKHDVSFYVLRAVYIHVVVFWVLTPYSGVVGYCVMFWRPMLPLSSVRSEWGLEVDIDID